MTLQLAKLVKVKYYNYIEILLSLKDPYCVELAKKVKGSSPVLAEPGATVLHTIAFMQHMGCEEDFEKHLVIFVLKCLYGHRARQSLLSIHLIIFGLICIFGISYCF